MNPCFLCVCVWRFEYRRRLNSNYGVAKIILDMMEENDIFFVGGGDSIYLAKSVHKKYSTKFVWGHSFSAYASYDHFFNPPSPVPTWTYFGWHPSLMDGLFLNQNIKTNIQILCLLKNRYPKKSNSSRVTPGQSYCTWYESHYLTLVTLF